MSVQMLPTHRNIRCDTSGSLIPLDVNPITNPVVTLQTGINSSVTSIVLALTSTTTLPNGVYVQFDSERVLVVSGGGALVIGNNPLTVVRGAWPGYPAASHTTSATVTIPGYKYYYLLSIAEIPNQDVRGAKVTTDINYQIIIANASAGDTFPQGAPSIILADNSAELGTFNLTAPADSHVWFQWPSAGAAGGMGSGGTPAALGVSFVGGTAQLNVAGYSAALNAYGGVPPYSFSISSGVLPTGMSLTGNTISGTPSVAGTFSFVAKVTDSASTTSTVSCTIVVNGAPEPPSSVTITESGPRVLSQSQQTFTTLKITVSEPDPGNLGTNLTSQINIGSTSWSNVVETNPSGSPVISGQRVTTIYIPGIVCLTTTQSVIAEAWSSNAYANPGQVGAVQSSPYTIAAIGYPSSVNVATLAVTNANGSTPTVANIFMGQNGLGNSWWQLNLLLTTAGNSDPNTFYYAVVVAWVNSSGLLISPGGADNNSGWQIQAQIPNDGQTHSLIDAESYPGPGINGYWAILVYAINRVAVPVFTPQSNLGPFSSDPNVVQQIGLQYQIGYTPSGNSTNMLVNPNFASQLVGWSSLNSGSGSTSYATISGITYGELIVPNGSSGADLYQAFIVRGSDSYTFEIWIALYSGSLGAGVVQLTLSWENNAGSPVGIPIPTNVTGLTSTIQPFFVTAVAPSTAVTLRIDAVASGGSSSNFTLILTNGWLAASVVFPLVRHGNSNSLQTDGSTTGVSAGGLSSVNSGALLNGTFESGVLIPWFVQGAAGATWSISTAENHTTDGSYSALVTVSSLTSSGVSYLLQNFACELGEVVVLKGWVFPDSSATNGEAYLLVYFVNAAGGIIGSLATNTISGTTGSWNSMLGVTAPAPANTVGAQIGIVVQNTTGTTSGKWYFDDVKVQIVQPGSGTQVSAAGAVEIAYGDGLQDNGHGLAEIATASPFTFVAGALSIGLSTDFVVSGGQLQQNAVNLAKAYGFNTTNFAVTGGSFVVNSIAVSTLIAGNTLNLGTSVFASSATAPYVEIGSAGLIMADNYTTPVHTIAVSSNGISIATYNNSYSTWASGTTYNVNVVVSYNNFNYISLVNSNTGHIPSSSPTYWALLGLSITSSAVGIYGPNSSLVVTANGVAVTNGSLVAQGTSGGVTKTMTLNPSANFLSGFEYVDSNTGNYTTIDPNSGFTAFASGGLTRGQLLYNALEFNGTQVVTTRQTGPGTPSGFADSVAQAWCLSLYNALNHTSGHGLIN